MTIPFSSRLLLLVPADWRLAYDIAKKSAWKTLVQQQPFSVLLTYSTKICRVGLICLLLSHSNPEARSNVASLYFYSLVCEGTHWTLHKQLARSVRRRNAGEKKVMKQQVWSVFLFLLFVTKQYKETNSCTNWTNCEAVQNTCYTQNGLAFKNSESNQMTHIQHVLQKERWSKRKKLPNVDGTRTRKYLSLQQLKLHNRYALKLNKNGEVFSLFYKIFAPTKQMVN